MLFQFDSCGYQFLRRGRDGVSVRYGVSCRARAIHVAVLLYMHVTKLPPSEL